MGNKFYRLGRCVLLAGCVVVINSASGTYLPQLGPAPLRFRPPPLFVGTVAMFPPLRLDDPASPVIAEIANPATNPPPAKILEPLGPPLPVPSAAIVATDSTAQPAPSPVVLDDTMRITPQMLVNFFRPGLNGTNAAPATVPAGSFTPPQPPSSSATYKSH